MPNLNVPANTVRTINANEEVMLVQNWTMGDNASIVFAPGVQTWTLVARRAVLGANVRIDGSGASGSSGPSGGPPAPALGGKCATGRHGSNGSTGTDGMNGIPIHIKVGIEAVRTLVIMSNGGDGGNGGAGQSGGKGAKSDCSRGCHGGSGGNGGRGGDAGHGGDGGSVHFEYLFLADPPVADPEDLITLDAEGGGAGTPGAGSRGGAGGDGKDCKWRKNRRGGPRGRNGAPGRAGTDGSDGPTMFEPLGGAPVPGGPSLDQLFEEMEGAYQ